MYLIYSVTLNGVVSINNNIFPNAFTINKQTQEYINSKKKTGNNIIVLDIKNYLRTKTRFYNSDYFILYDPCLDNPNDISLNDKSFYNIDILYSTLLQIEKLNQQEIFIVANLDMINYFINKVEFILQIQTSVNTTNIPRFARIPNLEIQKYGLDTNNLILVSSNTYVNSYEPDIFGFTNISQYNTYQSNIFTIKNIDTIQQIYINVITKQYVIGTQLNIDIYENKFFKWNSIYLKYRQDIFLLEIIKELYEYITFNIQENIIEYDDCEKIEKCNYYKILYRLHGTYLLNLNEFKLFSNNKLIFNQYNMLYIPSFNITFIREFNKDGYYDLYGFFTRIKEINIYEELPICLNTLLIVMYYFEYVFNHGNNECKFLHKLKKITFNCNYIYVDKLYHENGTNILNTTNLKNETINVVEYETIDKNIFTHIIVPV